MSEAALKDSGSIWKNPYHPVLRLVTCAAEAAALVPDAAPS